jgi:hypothetical protein
MEGNQMFLIFAPKRHKSPKQQQAAAAGQAKTDGGVKQGPPVPPGTGGMVQS